VTRYESRWLYRVDPTTGRGFDAVDLGPLADGDGLPEMSMMARDGLHLFIQIQRLDRPAGYVSVPPSYARGHARVGEDRHVEVSSGTDRAGGA